MGLSVNNPEALELASALAARTGESVDEAVVRALRERLERTPEPSESDRRWRKALEIARECAALPDLDLRSPDEILGYDEYGVPR
jgi:antitoxin VapB